MSKIKLPLLGFLLSITMISCGQDENVTKKIPATQTSTSEEEILKAKADNNKQPHEYGGWYCPDNFGFKPVDIIELDQVPVIGNRLPSREEARSASSLIYVDSEKFPDAYALEMDLPRLAKIYTPHKEMSELIIVIQAVVIGDDTIVGYRFPSGGNGSAWIGQVSFLTNEAVNDLGSRPMVYKKASMKAKKEDIWNYFTKTQYAKDLGIKFNKTEFFQSKWTANSREQLLKDEENLMARGWVSNHFGCIYMHIDYQINGEHYTEKMLICDSNEQGLVDLHFAAGPILNNFPKEEQKWEKLMADIQGMNMKGVFGQ